MQEFRQLVPPAMGVMTAVCLVLFSPAQAQTVESADIPIATSEETTRVQVQYLEVVTPNVDETCAALAAQHGVTFGEPVAMLGNARTADLKGGGRIGVRGPMRPDEAPVVRPYMLVDDIEAAIAAAEAAGAEFAMRATQIPGEGTFAIYLLGGIEHGIWQQ